MRQLLPVLAVILLTPATARADSDTTVQVSFTGGHMRLDGGSAAGIGLAVGYGRTVGPLTVLGEYSLMTVFPTEAMAEHGTGGTLHRFGLTARVEAAAMTAENGNSLALWVEGGLGRLMPRWDDGESRDLNDVMVGLAIQVRGRPPGDKRREWGFWIGARALLTPTGGDGDAPATCAGPCDRATPPAALGTGFLFVMGGTWR